MAKTNFVSGTVVTPAFLNAINAHTHDGADTDGHSAKIDLAAAANVTGVLPAANVDLASADPITASGTFVATFPTSKALTINYQKRTSGLIKLWWGERDAVDSSDTQTPTLSATLDSLGIKPTTTRIIGPLMFVTPTVLGYLLVSDAEHFYFKYSSAVTSISSAVVEYMQ